jgi:cation diffusion facilitator CzcD-associated flavoprotein CzcO
MSSSSLSSSFDVIVIGAGQCGVAMATMLVLKAPTLKICVLESSDAAGGSWRARWPGLALLSPAEFSNFLPNFSWNEFSAGKIPDDAFPTADEVARCVEAARVKFLTDVEFRFNCHVVSLSRVDPPPPPLRRAAPRATAIKEALSANPNVALAVDRDLKASASHQSSSSSHSTGGGSSDTRSAGFANVLPPTPIDGSPARALGSLSMPAPSAGVALHRMFQLVCHVDGDQRNPLTLRARQVVLATGSHRVPRLPRTLCAALGDASVAWLHSVNYRGFDASIAPLLADRGTLEKPVVIAVVGAGASGTQIATQIARSLKRPTAKVYLVGRDPGSLPRTSFGRDIYWWLNKSGLLTMDKDSFVGRRAMESQRGHGDQLVGSLTADAVASGVERISGRVVGFHSERGALRIVSTHDRLLGDANRGGTLVQAYEEAVDDAAVVRDDGAPKALGNGGWLRVDVVLFANGFVDGAERYEFVDDSGMFAAPDDGDAGAADARHSVWHQHDRGTCLHVPGLYVIGEPWLQRVDSSLLHGVAADARHLSNCIKALHREIGSGRHGSYRELTKLTATTNYESDEEDV